MAGSWRKWIRGPKHGVSRGVAVFGTPGSAPDSDSLLELLSSHERLSAWAQERGITLNGHAEDLAKLDHAIAERGDDPWIASMLAHESGLVLGTVLIASVLGAQWWVWPNGHPVVRLPSGGDIDVVALANERVTSGKPLLADAYAAAIAGKQL